MRLYIIGNGFDLAHSLPTKYWDFRRYLEKKHSEFLDKFEEHHNVYYGMSENEKKKILWNELEKNLANIDGETRIDDAMRMELDLESGDIGIKDTLISFFKEEYTYIKDLEKYLEEWVNTIELENILPKALHILEDKDNLFINFNYTSVLEKIYGIPNNKIVHIHGSTKKYDCKPILGHSDKNLIYNMENDIKNAELLYDEKWESICKVIIEYYLQTFKDVDKNMPKLNFLKNTQLEEINVIGHSISGVDIDYFKNIDLFTNHEILWKVYYYEEAKKDEMYNNLLGIGINKERIVMLHSSKFYDI